jgi:hypothetical protein
VAASFVITSPTNTVLLGTDRTGQAAFTVSNQTGRGVRARASVAALAPTQSPWLALAGASERDFPIGGTEQITVTVTVPPEAAAGLYPFRLDVASVVNPDEDWAQGPVVAFQVPELPPPPPLPVLPDPPGYIETLLGAYAGGLPLGALGVGLGLLALVSASGGSGDFWQDLFAAIAVAIIAVFFAAALGIIGLWVGSAVGAGMALRIRGFHQPWRTAVPLAVLFPVWAILVFAIVLSALSAANIDNGVVVVMAILVAALLSITVPALGARAFARWRMTGGL